MYKSDSADYFDKNGYVLLSDVLPKDQCDALVKHMFDLYEQGKLVKDEQCPLSDAVYGDPIFDDLLQKFVEPLSKNLGKELLPTYTYARIYRPGEVLKKHKDRPACEISTTLTLGYDAPSSWPIFVDEVKEIPVILEPGQMIAYKGCELLHWRPAFKGKWHVQVFFHYVDANGPYKDEYRDKRQSFGVDKQASNNLPVNQNNILEGNAITIPDPIVGGVVFPGRDTYIPGYYTFYKGHCPDPKLMFTKEECMKIRDIIKDTYPVSARIGGDNSSAVDKKVRAADIYNVDLNEKNKWIFNKVAIMVGYANTVYFDYDLTGIFHSIQLIHYKTDSEEPGHYKWHIDSGSGHLSTRKLSFTAQLSDPSEYDGCELIINNHGEIVTGNKEQGSIHMFPSYLLHQVTNITRGERFALVIWIHGNRRFR
jgi:predicted 2-oxoglutarate/Fe(II)-dependent dioxygenase YbiX